MSQRETISSVLAARGQQRREDRAAAAAEARADAAQRFEQKQASADRRRAQLDKALTWVRDNPVGLLMAAVIVVPGLLAWSAMAVTGEGIYGWLGVLLPLFTEAAMWAFAAKLHEARKHGRPTGQLVVGVWLFTAVSGGLNYLEGAAIGGWQTGLIMAVVATGGVVAHQLVTASPMRRRRTLAERRANRLARTAGRRTYRMERGVIRGADGLVDEHGHVELTYQPGTVRLSRSWTGRTQVQHRSLSEEVEAFLAGLEDPVPDAADTPVPESRDRAADQQQDRGQDTPVPDAENASETASVTPLRSGRSWSWPELVAAFWTHVEAGQVTPTSQRNVRTVLGCSRDRARDLVALYDAGDDGGPAAVAA